MTSAQQKPRIFVSHSKHDNGFVKSLVQDLRQELGDENAVWYDSRDEPRDKDTQWNKIIEELISRPFFIVVLSPDALSSSEVHDEINVARREKHPELGERIIPILYRRCKQIPPSLDVLQIIDFLPSKDYETAFTELLLALGLRTDTKPKTFVKEPDNPRTAIAQQITIQIQVAFAERDWSTVISKVDYLLEQMPAAMTPKLYRMQGQALREIGDVQLAQQAFAIATIVSEQRLAEGDTYLNAKRYKEALTAYDRAIAFDPDLAAAYNNKGLALYYLHRYKEALRTYEQAIHLEPNMALIYFNQGLALERLGIKGWAESTRAYEKARRLGFPFTGRSITPSNTTAIIEALEKIACELPTNRLTQSVPTISSYVIGRPITPRPDASSRVKSLLILLAFIALFVILGGEVLVIYNLISDTIAIDNSQATATAQANATYTATDNAHATATAQVIATYAATASVVANNPDPYPPTKGMLILYNPLSQPSEWENRSDSSYGGICQFTDGAYHVSESQTNHIYECFAQTSYLSNFAFEVQMKITKGGCGGISFYNPESTYRYLICQDGGYALLLSTPSSYYKILRNQYCSAIHKGLNQSNVIALIANQGILDFYINHQKVDTIQNSSASYSLIGTSVLTLDKPAEVVYSYARIWTF